MMSPKGDSGNAMVVEFQCAHNGVAGNNINFESSMLIRLTPKHTMGSLAAETRCRHARRCPAPRGSALSGFTARVPAPLSCDAACAAYLEAIRWRDGFVCKWCGEASEPYRFANRPQVLRCRKCQRDNALTAG